MGYRHINTFSMELSVKNYFLKREQICEDKKSADKKIDPLSVPDKEQGAYIRFINIDSTNNKQIVKFCNAYGLLFDNISSGRIYNGEVQELLQKMSIEDFVIEVKTFRLIVEFYCDIAALIPDEQDKEQRIRIFKEKVSELRQLSVYNSVYFDFIIDELEDGNDSDKINEYLLAIVRRHIQDYTNKIHINIDCDVHKTSETKTTAIDLKGNLLSAMYFRFYLDIVNNVPIKKCKDPKCKNIFAAYKREDKLYCSGRCSKNHGMRESRKRIKVN